MNSILEFPQNNPQKKFMADIIYGMLASGSCLLTKVAQELCEDSRKINEE